MKDNNKVQTSRDALMDGWFTVWCLEWVELRRRKLHGLSG